MKMRGMSARRGNEEAKKCASCCCYGNIVCFILACYYIDHPTAAGIRSPLHSVALALAGVEKEFCRYGTLEPHVAAKSPQYTSWVQSDCHPGDLQLTMHAVTKLIPLFLTARVSKFHRSIIPNHMLYYKHYLYAGACLVK